MSTISVQVSLYPLRQTDLEPAISKAIETYRARTRRHGGNDERARGRRTDAVFDALKTSFQAADALGDVVMTAAISNRYPMPAVDRNDR